MNNLDKESSRRTFQNVNIFLTLSLLELKGINHPHFCWSPQYSVFKFGLRDCDGSVYRGGGGVHLERHDASSIVVPLLLTFILPNLHQYVKVFKNSRVLFVM